MGSAKNIDWVADGFLWCGIVTMGIGILVGVRRLMAITRWGAASGEVMEAALEEKPNVKTGSLWAAEVTVQWRAGEQVFARVFNQWGASRSRGHYSSIVDRYPVGSTTEVRYDPAQPMNAYIEADYSVRFFLLPVLFTAGGLALAALGYFVGRLPARG